MRLSPQSLARASSRHAWRTVGLWVLAVVVSGGLIGSLLTNALTQEAKFTNRPEAVRAADLVEDRLTGPERAVETFIVTSESTTVDDRAFRAEVEELRSKLQALGPEVVEGVQTFYDTNEPNFVSQDRRTTIVPVVLAGERQEASDHAHGLREVAGEVDGGGFDVQVFGPATFSEDLNKAAEEDLLTGEMIGIPVALIVLVIVFGAVVAALLPLIMAIAAIVLAVATVAVVGQLADFSFFVTNMITMMGLAVGIDYSLFVVSRFREEQARGLGKLEAIEAAGATASRAVLFSGLTVVLALAGMFLIPSTIFRSVAAGAIFVVLFAVASSLTLLPALLSLLGDRINSLRVRRKRPGSGAGKEGGFWDKVSHGVMRRPVVSLVVGVGILLACAFSWKDMNTGFAGVSTLPNSFEAKQAFDHLSENFPGGLSSPLKIVVDGPVNSPEVQAGIQELQGILAGDEFFGPTQVQVNDGRDLALITAPLNGDPSSEAAVSTISEVRDDYVPAAFGDVDGVEVLVGGDTAFNKDFFDTTARYMPIVFAFVLGLSFILLTVAFRSIVVPIKALILNLLSVGAAYGLLVLVSQKGVFAGVLGFQQVEAIEAWLPLFLFSVLFGLSMDYHVFLLSRIREHYDQTGDNTESVAYGVRTTAGIITGAALIMVAVFGGFASGKLVMFQQMGFGLAVAVLIDATIVRTLLVPASMKLLGSRNWYLPKWLEWLPKVTVEGPHLEPPPEPKVREPVKA